MSPLIISCSIGGESFIGALDCNYFPHVKRIFERIDRTQLVKGG